MKFVRRRLESTAERCPFERCWIMVTFSPWLSSHCLPSFYAILHVLYTYLSKIISAIFFCGRLHIRSHSKFLTKYINFHFQRENSVTFLDFRISQSNVATYCRWGSVLCSVYIENFLTDQLVKEFWKSVHICQSYYQTSSGFLFSDTV